MSSRIIIGKAENIKISETIDNYNPNFPEQILTAKKINMQKI